MAMGPYRGPGTKDGVPTTDFFRMDELRWVRENRLSSALEAKEKTVPLVIEKRVSPTHAIHELERFIKATHDLAAFVQMFGATVCLERNANATIGELRALLEPGLSKALQIAKEIEDAKG